jgi:hypothetical protein
MRATEMLEGLKGEILALSKYEDCGIVVNSISAEEKFNAAIEAHKCDLLFSIPETITDKFPGPGQLGMGDFEIERCNPACPLYPEDRLCAFELTSGGCHSPGKGCPRYAGNFCQAPYGAL